MSEETEQGDNEIIEEGGKLEDWEPIDPRDRTEASPVQRAYERILREIQERIQRIVVLAGLVALWKPEPGEPSDIPLPPPKPKPPTEPPKPPTEPPTK